MHRSDPPQSGHTAANVIRVRGNALRRRILQVAETLFYRHGSKSVGINEVVEKAEITKATLYRHFASKEELILAYMRERDERIRTFLTEIRQAMEPPSAILAVFERLDEKLAQPDFRGCAFLLVAAEQADSSAIRAAARDHKVFVRDFFRSLVVEINDDLADTAEQFALLYDGALAVGALRPESMPAKHAHRAAATILSTITHGSHVRA